MPPKRTSDEWDEKAEAMKDFICGCRNATGPCPRIAAVASALRRAHRQGYGEALDDAEGVVRERLSHSKGSLSCLNGLLVLREAAALSKIEVPK